MPIETAKQTLKNKVMRIWKHTVVDICEIQIITIITIIIFIIIIIIIMMMMMMMMIIIFIFIVTMPIW